MARNRLASPVCVQQLLEGAALPSVALSARSPQGDHNKSIVLKQYVGTSDLLLQVTMCICNAASFSRTTHHGGDCFLQSASSSMVFLMFARSAAQVPYDFVSSLDVAPAAAVGLTSVTEDVALLACSDRIDAFGTGAEHTEVNGS
jgi:hypothetical protein